MDVAGCRSWAVVEEGTLRAFVDAVAASPAEISARRVDKAFLTRGNVALCNSKSISLTSSISMQREICRLRYKQNVNGYYATTGCSRVEDDDISPYAQLISNPP